VSDEPINPPTKEPAWIKLYHHRGVEVRIPLHCGLEPLPLAHFAALVGSIDNALSAGLLLQAPGLEEGETREMIGSVVHREKENEDGTITPIVDLYVDDDRMEYSILSVYLNHDKDAAAFERASGMKLAGIPVYVGAGKLQRGASRQTDKMILKAPKPFALAWKPNPRHNPEETDSTKKKPKRIFSRWPDLAPETAANEPVAAVKPVEEHPLVVEWIVWLGTEPTLLELNERLPQYKSLPMGPDKQRINGLLTAYARNNGWAFDATTVRFIVARKETANAGN
jgi:hypothetical protein